MLKGTAAGKPVTVGMITQMVESSPEPQRTALMNVIAAPEGADPDQIERIVEKCGRGPEHISTVLQEVMDAMGHLSHGTVLEVTRQTGVAASHIYHLATTQRSFSVTPPAEHRLRVCAGTGCHVRDKAGHGEALERASAEKKSILCDKVRCLGCCDSGPMAEVDGEKMTLEAARARVKGL
jgi:NADH:ubiquinone oxidoreductase subunit E